MKTWTYKIPSEKNWGGWAVIFLTDTGVFSTVSDYGNYGYIWSHHGMKDVRQFFLTLLKEPGEWYYFAQKLNPKTVYNGEKTVQNILDYLDNSDLSDSEIEDEKILLSEYQDLYSEFDYQCWCLESGTNLDWHNGEFAIYELDHRVKDFCQKVLPKFAELLQKQLKEEGIE